MSPRASGSFSTPLPYHRFSGQPDLPPIILQSAAKLRPSDFGLDTILNDLPEHSDSRSASRTRRSTSTQLVSLTLSGVVGNTAQGVHPQPDLVRHPYRRLRRRHLRRPTATGTTTFDTVNCGAEPFSPEFSAAIKVGKANDAVELSTTIAQTIDEAGLQSAQVILPKDLFGNANALAISCPAADFDAGNCPANTIVGSAVAGSPLQSQPLTGPVALVAPARPAYPTSGSTCRGRSR